MVHYGNNVLTNSYKRSTKTTIHWILLTLGGTCGAAGALIKMIQKGFLLQSTHGRLGELSDLKLACTYLTHNPVFCRHNRLYTLPAVHELRTGGTLLATCQETDHATVEQSASQLFGNLLLCHIVGNSVLRLRDGLF